MRSRAFAFCFLIFFSFLSIAGNKVVMLQSSDSKAILESKALSESNTTYIVKSTFDLNSKTIRLKGGSEIQFEGGNFSNGVLYLEPNTSIKGSSSYNLPSKKLKIQLGGENINISDFQWSNDGGIALLSYASCNHLRINNCNISSAADNCVKIVADNVKGVIKDIVISNCSFAYKRMGIEIQNHGNNDYKIDGVIIRGCNFHLLDNQSKYGFALSLSGYGKNAEISNCAFNGVKVGVELVGFSYVTIKDNRFESITSKPIVSSNKRKMKHIIIENNHINCPTSKIQLSNTDHVYMRSNDMKVSYIEMIGCSDCVVSDNTIEADGHYVLILDGGASKSNNNAIKNNMVKQKGDNWAVFRCYGAKCHGNLFTSNHVTKISKKGKTFDQVKGASNNSMR